MGVLAEAISVMVPVSVLDAKYPGGRVQYVDDAPNATYCCDCHLTRIGFMVPEDVQRFVGYLATCDIRHIVAGKSVDCVVVDQTRGPTAPCEWLEFAVHEAGFGIAWIKGTPAQPMYAPDAWSIEQSQQVEFVAGADVPDRLVPLAREDGNDVYLDLATGREGYVGRVRAALKARRWTWW